MAHWSGAVGDIYPVGTSVSAYTAKQRSKSDGAPIGQPVETATVDANSRLTFTKLAGFTDYVAAALVAGKWRYIEFLTPGTDQPILESTQLYVNVKDDDFGAVGDAITDDSGAIQSAIDYVASKGGGTVFIPAGIYAVNSGLSVPPGGAPIRLLGAGMEATQLRRTSGTTTMLRAGDDTSNIFVAGYALEICDLKLHGMGSAGYIADVTAIQPFNLHNVSFTGSTAGGVRCRQMFNSRWMNVSFSAMGNGTAQPAVELSSLNMDQGNVDTLFIFNGQWIGNNGTDFKLTGYQSGGVYRANSNANAVQVVNFQMEGGTASALNAPYLDLDMAAGCKFSSGHVSAHGGGANNRPSVTPIRVAFPSGLGASKANHFTDLTIEKSGTGTYSHSVEVFGDIAVLMESIVVIGGATAAVHIDSTASSGKVQIGKLFHNLARGVKDDRSSVSVASAASIGVPYHAKLLAVTGGTNITSLTLEECGFEIVLVFIDGCTVVDSLGSGGNLNLAGNFPATALDTLKLVSDGSFAWHELSRSVN